MAERCRHCGYPISDDAPGEVCPECGRPPFVEPALWHGGGLPLLVVIGIEAAPPVLLALVVRSSRAGSGATRAWLDWLGPLWIEVAPCCGYPIIAVGYIALTSALTRWRTYGPHRRRDALVAITTALSCGWALVELWRTHLAYMNM